MDEFIEEFLGYLNLIYRLAMNENARNTQNTVQNIASLLKYKSLRKDEIVTLREELLYVEKLIDIFNERFGKNLEFSMNIEDGFTDLYIPNYTLAAFVENSLFHGLTPKDGSWKLSLDIEADEKNIKAIITDNGIGFDVSKTDSNKNSSDKHGTIPNIKLQLKTCFKLDDMVHIVSSPGKGTKVYITIPKANC